MSPVELAQMQNTNKVVLGAWCLELEGKPLFRLTASPTLKELQPKALSMLNLMFQLTACCKAGKMAGLK
ncbi:hypothetical protein YA0697_21650 [Pseudomonas viridiflava]|uniref:hypothetical protein n=1 Tax=Pseudomonas viridiflava TaxID=33069 RepID=UPI0018E653CB|nr:hypothetical protein [Pseudomonas viridiflava]MBI6684316.1 hypothetical protein [Pseudomonas viridiflava]